MSERTSTATGTTHRPLWRERDFATYWAGQGISQLGDRVSELALPLTAVGKPDKPALRTRYWGSATRRVN